MKVYVDSENKIRAVGTTTDTSLTEVFIDETADSFPFKGWSTAKICCYKVNVVDGIVTMMTPYVDSRLLDMVDTMGHQIDKATPYTDKKTAYIDDSEVVFFNVPEGALLVSFSNGNMDFTLKRVDNALKVNFEPLEEVVTITIKIQ